ncbi:MAG TPA: PfkB family carbohydrate kinase [Gemmatimonadota bacterium]|nr:PfkB family carbohydrate kinase [Gemmatimonadota bacterium]
MSATGLRTLGVSGTFVQDTIDTVDGVRTRDLGGITYALATLSALLPDGVRARPVVAVGEDALPSVRDFLATLPGIVLDGLVPVTAVNNKVRLEYFDDGTREETLTGGVPPLGWSAFQRWIPSHDIWLWNLISGMEIDLATFERIKSECGAPVYLDLHNLCLEHVPEGPRRLRRPADWKAWVSGVRWLQLNAQEAGLLQRGDPATLEAGAEAALAARVHELGAEAMFVTRGAEGATWYGAGGEVVVAPGVHAEDAIDPTGCGDVFGAAWLALHLAHGWSPEEALAGAVEAAGIAATLRGTRELRSALVEASIGLALTPGRRAHGD